LADIYAALLTIVQHCLHDDASLGPQAAKITAPFSKSTYQENNFLLPSRKDAAVICLAVQEASLA
jgi:hypothetical protein